VLGKNERCLGGRNIQYIQHNQSFPQHWYTSSLRISGSQTGLAAHAHRIFHMILSVQGKMLKIGQHGFVLYTLILPSIYQPTNALKKYSEIQIIKYRLWHVSNYYMFWCLSAILRESAEDDWLSSAKTCKSFRVWHHHYACRICNERNVACECITSLYQLWRQLHVLSM